METRGLIARISSAALVVVLCSLGCNGGRGDQEGEAPVGQAAPAGSATEEDRAAEKPLSPEAVPVEPAREETPEAETPPSAPAPAEQKAASTPEPAAEAPPPEPLLSPSSKPVPAAPAPETMPPAPPPETMPPAPAPETMMPPTPEPFPPPSLPEPEIPEIIEVTVAAGTVLELELLTSLDSSLNRVNDEIQARTIAPIYVDGEPVLPSGTYVEGRVTEVEASGRVQGRARLGFTFDRLSTLTGLRAIRTSYVDQEASSGTGKDAKVVGGGAGIGALIGGILGGKRGAAIGATIGGAGGAGVVLSTKGEEIRLPVGTQVNVRLDEPVQLQIN